MTEDQSNSSSGRHGERREAERKRRRERHFRRRREYARHGHAGKSWIGILIIAAGVVWLARVLGAPVPAWLFTWPVALIAFGLVSGIGSGFRNIASYLLILIGLVFLAHNSLWPGLDMEKYVWPLVLIFIGIAFLVKRHRWDRKKEWLNQHHPEWKDWHTHLREHWQSGCAGRGAMPSPPPPEPPAAQAPTAAPASGEQGRRRPHSGEDWMDITTVFGGTRRQIFSKDFKGGDLVNVCGGTEIDLTHADIEGTVVIDVVALWGGVRVAVPPNWQVRLDVTHIMGGTDVHRGDPSAVQDPAKVLVFTGTVMMAGIEVRDVL